MAPEFTVAGRRLTWEPFQRIRAIFSQFTGYFTIHRWLTVTVMGLKGTQGIPVSLMVGTVVPGHHCCYWGLRVVAVGSIQSQVLKD